MSKKQLDMSPEAVQKRLQNRANVAQEIYESEQTFVELLNTMEKVYFEPSKKILHPKVASAVFSNVLTLRDLNKKFAADLKERVDSWGPTSTIGDLFLQFAPFFKMYTQYVNNHERIGPLMSQLKHHKKYAVFQEFEAQQRKLPETANQKLESYLIAPVQRIPRYKILLKRLLKNTEPDHPDHSLLQDALNKVELVAIHINDAVRASENRRVILDIQRKFENLVLIAPHRFFVVAGTLIKKSPKVEDKPFKFFLFNDQLLWARHRNAGGKYKLVGRVVIDEKFDVELIPDKLEKHCMRVIYDQQSFLLKASSDKDANGWFRELRKCIEDRMRTISGKRTHNRRHSFVMAAQYQDKAKVPECSLCNKEFGLMRKKYNCKSCGQVVCAGCSRARLLVEALHRKVRVCALCVEKVADNLAVEVSQAVGHSPKIVAKKPVKGGSKTKGRHDRDLSISFMSTVSTLTGSVSDSKEQPTTQRLWSTESTDISTVSTGSDDVVLEENFRRRASIVDDPSLYHHYEDDLQELLKVEPLSK